MSKLTRFAFEPEVPSRAKRVLTFTWPTQPKKQQEGKTR